MDTLGIRCEKEGVNVERLTKRINGYAHGAEGVTEEELTGNYCRGEFEATACVEKLAEYEDLEEQGLFMRFPCKVGDTVAIILMLPESGKFFINQAEVREINIGKYHLRHDMKLKLEPVEKRGTSYKYYASDWGKYVFSSLAEAEQALAKMKEV